MKRRSPSMMITGITLWVLGSAAVGVGAAMFFDGESTSCPVVFEGHRGPLRRAAATGGGGERVGTAQEAFLHCVNDGLVAAGNVTLLAGLFVSLGGIPLFVFGNQKVRASPESSLVPALRVGAGAARLRWSF
jgi:hypothetical protein